MSDEGLIGAARPTLRALFREVGGPQAASGITGAS